MGMKYRANENNTENSNASDTILSNPVSDADLLRICHVQGTHGI